MARFGAADRARFGVLWRAGARQGRRFNMLPSENSGDIGESKDCERQEESPQAVSDVQRTYPFTLKPIKRVRVSLTLRGTSPLVMQKWDEKHFVTRR